MVEVLDPMDGFKFGCDPELFVVNPDGEYVSAAGLIPGTKANPFPVKCGAVQVDGMAAEFNIDPVDNFTDFNTNIIVVMKQLKAMLPPGYNLQAAPSVVFSEKVWAEAQEQAKELGCTPDFNAWTGEINPPPHDPENPRLRTASGHIHVGWTEDADFDAQHIMNCRDLVKQLDWHLGAWSVKQDSDATRRRLYGKAGACRYKPYGVEYRVLSNFWVTTSARRLQVWNRLQNAIWGMSSNFFPDREGGKYNPLLIETINTSRRNSLLESKFSFPIVNAY